MFMSEKEEERTDTTEQNGPLLPWFKYRTLNRGQAAMLEDRSGPQTAETENERFLTILSAEQYLKLIYKNWSWIAETETERLWTTMESEHQYLNWTAETETESAGTQTGTAGVKPNV